MAAYYNENDPFAAAWLRELINEGLIADGEVDSRSITDVQPADVRGFSQCHWFAGIGGWSVALRLAGWDDDRPVWTGSCPCQPFSAAGKGAGFDDSRHLWPTWFRLIRECRPDVVFGEQVASRAGLAWFDHVATDLEETAYTVGACDLGAPSVCGFHIRQRLWYVADTDGGHPLNGGIQRGREHGFGAEDRCVDGDSRDGQRTESAVGHANSTGLKACVGVAVRDGSRSGQSSDSGSFSMADTEHTERRPLHLNRQDGRHGQDHGREETYGESRTRGEVCDLADPELGRCEQRHAGERGVSIAGENGDMGDPSRGRQRADRRAPRHAGYVDESGPLGNVGHADDSGREQYRWTESARAQQPAAQYRSRGAHWDACVWHLCRDGKRRPIPTEPALFPLVNGLQRGRVGLLRGAGNAIVPQVAAVFIQAYCDARSAPPLAVSPGT